MLSDAGGNPRTHRTGTVRSGGLGSPARGYRHRDHQQGRRTAVEEGTHARNLGALVGVHVGGEAEQLRLLGGAGAAEERRDHRERALVVANHVLEEEPVEGGARGRGERRQLRRGEHPGHERVVAASVVTRARRSPPCSEAHMLPSGPAVMPARTRFGRPCVNSVICPVGVMRPIRPGLTSVNHRLPRGRVR